MPTAIRGTTVSHFLLLLHVLVHNYQAPVERVLVDVDLCVVGSLQDELFKVAEVCELIELHFCDVFHILLELYWTAMAEFRVRDFIFHPTYFSRTLRTILRCHELPWQAAREQSDDHVAESDQVIATRELVAFM